MHTDVNDSTKSNSQPSDAPDGKLFDFSHSVIAVVPQASSAMITGLELGGCVGTSALESRISSDNLLVILEVTPQVSNANQSLTSRLPPQPW